MAEERPDAMGKGRSEQGDPRERSASMHVIFDFVQRESSCLCFPEAYFFYFHLFWGGPRNGQWGHNSVPLNESLFDWTNVPSVLNVRKITTNGVAQDDGVVQQIDPDEPLNVVQSSTTAISADWTARKKWEV